VGLGIIRSIDATNRFFYVLTPVPAEELSRVTIFLKGSLELPTLMLYQGNASFVEPYLMSMTNLGLAGAGRDHETSATNLSTTRTGKKKKESSSSSSRPAPVGDAGAAPIANSGATTVSASAGTRRNRTIGAKTATTVPALPLGTKTMAPRNNLKRRRLANAKEMPRAAKQPPSSQRRVANTT